MKQVCKGHCIVSPGVLEKGRKGDEVVSYTHPGTEFLCELKAEQIDTGLHYTVMQRRSQTQHTDNSKYTQDTPNTQSVRHIGSTQTTQHTEKTHWAHHGGHTEHGTWHAEHQTLVHWSVAAAPNQYRQS